MVIVAFKPGEKEISKYEELDQYDYGQILRIQGLNLPPAVEIHFALQKTGGTSKNRIGITKDGVTDVPIPDSMLENGDTEDDYSIYAFIYITDETSGQTEYRITLRVKARPKPEVPGSGDNPDIFHEVMETVRKAMEAATESEKQAEGWAHGREDLPERTQDNAKYYSDQAREDSVKTDADRKEVKRLVESVSGISEQVEKVEGLTKQAQTSATNAALSEQAAKESENNATQARAGAEVAEDNAELAAQKVEQDKAIVEQTKNLVKQMGQEVLDNKKLVDEAAQDFDLKAQQALADVNNAGQAQTERVQTAGNGAVESVKAAQGTATRAVETAKTEAIEAVQTEGTTQAGNVSTEGEKQVQAVRGAAQEIMADREQIQENKTGIAKLKEELVGLEFICKKENNTVYTAEKDVKVGYDINGKIMDCDLMKGSNFKINVHFTKGAITGYINLYYINNEGIKTVLDIFDNDIEKTFIAKEDIKSFTVYVDKSKVVSNTLLNVKVTRVVENPNSLENKIENLENINLQSSPNLFGLEFINGKVTSNGEILPLVTGKSYACANGKINVTGGELYAIQFLGPKEASTIYINQYNANNSITASKSFFADNKVKIVEILPIELDTSYLTVSVYKEGVDWKNLILENIQIENGETATDYKPHDAVEYAIPFLKKKINSIENGNLPPYYGAYINKKNEFVEKKLRETFVHGDAFYFITDMHWDKNAQKSPEIIREMQKKINIDKLFTGGDITGNGYSNSPLLELRKAMGNKSSVYSISGNHEYIGEAKYNDISYMQNAYHQNDVVYGDFEKTYYYTDNKSKKIRYIVLASYGEAVGGVSQSLYTDTEQLKWFTEIALNVDVGWTIVILTHCFYAIPSYSDGTTGNVIEQPEQLNHGFTEAIKNYNGKGIIACIIQGHLHFDRIFKQEGMPPVISVASDKNLPWIENGVNKEPHLSERKTGSLKEQAFDVVIINTSARKLYFVRIGCPAMDGINLDEGKPVEIREVIY